MYSKSILQKQKMVTSAEISIAESMILLLFNRFCASFQDIFERSKSHLKKVKGSLPLKVLQENECVDLCQIYEGLKGSDQIK